MKSIINQLLRLKLRMFTNDVNLDIGALSGTVVTERTLVRPFPRVCADMALEVACLLESGPTTEGTLVGQWPAVSSRVDSRTTTDTTITFTAIHDHTT